MQFSVARSSTHVLPVELPQEMMFSYPGPSLSCSITVLCRGASGASLVWGWLVQQNWGCSLLQAAGKITL